MAYFAVGGIRALFSSFKLLATRWGAAARMAPLGPRHSEAAGGGYTRADLRTGAEYKLLHEAFHNS